MIAYTVCTTVHLCGSTVPILALTSDGRRDFQLYYVWRGTTTDSVLKPNL